MNDFILFYSIKFTASMYKKLIYIRRMKEDRQLKRGTVDLTMIQ